MSDERTNRKWPELEQPFTDNLMDEVLRNMSDLELDLLGQRNELQRENAVLRETLREIRRDIEESADDVVWMRGGIETVCDRITAVLGDQNER